MRTPAENERLVREHWLKVVVVEFGNSKPLWIHNTVQYMGVGPFADESEMWAAAAEFTEQRLKDVRQVEMELALLRGLLFLLSAEPGDMTAPIWERVVVREQAALESLKRGMRQ